ncbi:hypothetical protein C0991_005376 [Blastosporella zonata]|nr:hypothetical protein C0991_005376 [Blastosporella zonata]
MSTPSKSRWGRIGGVVRRASLVMGPSRTSTPSIASIERDSDVASLKGSVRSVPFSPPAVLVPPKPAASHPSPIPESPVQPQNEPTQPSAFVPSPLVPVPDPEPVASPVQEYTPPPLIDSTAVGPGGFTDDSDDLPQPLTIRDPSRAPSPLQEDSADGHEPAAIEPVTTSRLGGFDDDVELPKPQVIEEPSLQRTESMDSYRPPITDSAAVTGGFDDDLDLPQPQVIKEPSVQEVDDTTRSQPSPVPTTPEPPIAQPLVPTVPNTPESVYSQPLVPTAPATPEPDVAQSLPPTEPSTPVRVDTVSYFDLPIRDEPIHDAQLSPDSLAGSTAQNDDDVFEPQPGTETQEDKSFPVVPDDISDDNESETEVQMPTAPEPVTQVSSVVPAYVPQFESYQEVWGGVVHRQDEELNKDANPGTKSGSRAASIHNLPAEDLFANPLAPRITVSHHDRLKSQNPTNNLHTIL